MKNNIFDLRSKRIVNKLESVKEKDKNFKVFGASSHKYNLNKKLSKDYLELLLEQKNLTLPEEFFIFLTEVGNGGAGPYYGMHSIEQILKKIEFSNSYLKPCVLYPDMDNDTWNNLIAPVLNDVQEDEYILFLEDLFSGMIKIGSQGQGYEMYLVLNGEHKGKVVYTDYVHKDKPFFFIYESNFLDWYERWLSEILLDYDVDWYGYKIGGNEEEVISLFYMTNEDKNKIKILTSMFKFNSLSKNSIDELLEIYETYKEIDFRISYIAIHLVTKSNFNIAKPYLIKLMYQDNVRLLSVLQLINWYSTDDDVYEFLDLINPQLDKIDNIDTVTYISYLYSKNNLATIEKLKSFFYSKNSSLVSQLVYITRNDPNKRDNIDIIEKLFIDNNEVVIKTLIKHWDFVPHHSLVKYYKNLWATYKDDIGFRTKYENCVNQMKLITAKSNTEI